MNKRIDLRPKLHIPMTQEEQVVLMLRDEIADLRAQLKRAEDERDEALENFGIAQEEYDRQQKRACDAEAERDALKVALEQIEDYLPPKPPERNKSTFYRLNWERARDIASAALKAVRS